ncbi:hypothetical protein [Gottfriedia acidiceleris]|uniref:hypothetical protein n=1 Tax=Gottfriedia acidiceleris TaxID=371036 RepID=UPI000B44258C|nr:hypothetical protein [Gottfriedia acidiceleris]
MGQNKHAHDLQKRLNTFHTKHNQRVAEFHKQHLIQIVNGNGLMSKWERYIYFKGRDLFKTLKGMVK